VRVVRYHEEARAEFLHEVGYYTQIDRALGERFDTAVQAVESRVSSHPEMGSPYQHGTRKAYLNKFPFAMIYMVLEDGIYVIAIASFKKKPGYWRSRLNDSWSGFLASHVRVSDDFMVGVDDLPVQNRDFL
jgi:toxin ParE1/3/4